MRLISRPCKQTNQHRPFPWPICTLVLTAGFFFFSQRCTASVADQFDGPSGGYGQFPPNTYWDPSWGPNWAWCRPFGCQPPVPPSPDVGTPGEPTPAPPEYNSAPPPASKGPPGLPQPPRRAASAPPGPGTPTDPAVGGNNESGHQQQGESEKRRRSNPNVGKKLGWAFLAAALLLQLALAGFLGYKRFLLERYGVRLEQVTANASPPHPTAFPLHSNRLH